MKKSVDEVEVVEEVADVLMADCGEEGFIDLVICLKWVTLVLIRLASLIIFMICLITLSLISGLTSFFWLTLGQGLKSLNSKENFLRSR